MSISNTADEKEYSGIHGVLILFAIIVIIRPFLLSYLSYSTFSDIFFTDTWELLTDPSSISYHAFWKPLLFFEISVSIISILLALVALFLFLKKSKHFPKTFIITLVASVIFNLIDIVLCKQIPAIVELGSADIYVDLLKNIFALALWGTYVLKSKRVKNTFIR